MDVAAQVILLQSCNNKMFVSSYFHFIVCLFTCLFVALGCCRAKIPLVQNANELVVFLMWFSMLLLRLSSGAEGFAVCVWVGEGVGGEGKNHPTHSLHEFLLTEIVCILSRQYRDNPVSKELRFWLSWVFLPLPVSEENGFAALKLDQTASSFQTPGSATLTAADAGSSDAAMHLFCLHLSVKRVSCACSLMIRVENK